MGLYDRIMEEIRELGYSEIRLEPVTVAGGVKRWVASAVTSTGQPIIAVGDYRFPTLSVLRARCQNARVERFFFSRQCKPLPAHENA